MKKTNYLSVSMLAALAFFTQIGCGGGGGSGFEEEPTWTQGVFEDESQFKNFCAVPRTGVDANGNGFPDQQGNLLNENNWLRSWSNDTYLWYSEIFDQDPGLFNDTASYFNVLKTTATTASGNDKDNFHFSLDTADWLQQSQSGVSAGYGAEWAIKRGTPPREIVVAFVESNTPATTANLARGAEILEIDGVDVVNAGDQASVDVLNAGLFPSATGESHTFLIRDLGSTQTREVTMLSSTITSDPVLVTDTLSTTSGNVGYLLFNTHNAVAEERLFEAVTELAAANINDLVLDLRYNGGGFLAIASQMSYMIAGDAATQNQTFELTSFNDKYPNTNPVTGEQLSPTPFYSESLGFGNFTAGQDLPTLDLNRVFILSTAGTCSASEAIINGLRGIDIEVILIGDTTCGKPYGFYATDNCGTTYFTIQFSGENAKGFGEYSDGFSPANATNIGTPVTGCSVSDDFNNALGNPQEALLQTALSYRDNGSCPTVVTKVSEEKFTGLTDDGIAITKPPVFMNRILQKPAGIQ